MRDLRHLMLHVKTYGRKHEGLYLLSLVILFWAIFDGITSYITPLILTERGLSKTAMGLIIGSSSVTGAVFDFLMCKVFKNSYWRRIFLVMFCLCAFYLFILAAAQTVWMFILAMALWGIYYDLKNFGSFDFIARFTKVGEHGSSFGVLTVFQAGGYLAAPVVAGLLIGETVGLRPFLAAGIFLALAFALLLGLFAREPVYPQEKMETQYRFRGFIFELKLWRRIDRVLLPVLLMITILSIIDAFFWTIGPLLAESFTSMHPLAGLFMVAYELPALLIGWFVGSVTNKLGKKKTAIFGLLGGSAFLSLLGWMREPGLILLTVLFASVFLGFAWPALRAAFADYIQEAGRYEKEIEGLEDFYNNLGYVIGPASAGILADVLGNARAFSAVGILGMATALILMKLTPKKIVVSI